MNSVTQQTFFGLLYFFIINVFAVGFAEMLPVVAGFRVDNLPVGVLGAAFVGALFGTLLHLAQLVAQYLHTNKS
ncbi:MAG: hypothetical protein II671_07435 [Salinivirgaceae bacterium]|nr:hypothetical protein [Salinivirgaceae bacterium]